MRYRCVDWPLRRSFGFVSFLDNPAPTRNSSNQSTRLLKLDSVPMVVIVNGGSDTETNDLQSKKMAPLMVCSDDDDGSETEVKDVQPEKALGPMAVSDGGSDMDTNDVQP